MFVSEANGQLINFSDWFPAALNTLGILILALVLSGLFFGYLVAAFRHGAGEGFYIVAQTVFGAVPDFLYMSPRRIWAIARLAIKEAIRRRVVMVTFGLFALAIMFGGWFMQFNNDHPDRVYLNFVSFGTQMLILFMGILLSSFSLPDDIVNKTIYTVVTKPVRASEIVVGRIVGFALIGTLLLAAMGIISYLFVTGGLSHSHQIVGETQTIASFSDIDPEKRLNALGRRVSNGALKTFETTSESGHRHVGELIEDVRAPEDLPLDMQNVVSKETLENGKIRYLRVILDQSAGHTHPVTVEGTGDDATISIGNAYGFFRARVPFFGSELTFYDFAGNVQNRGVDIGRENQRQGFIDGGTYMLPNTLSRAEFVFENFRRSLFPEGEYLVLEMNLGAFRTTKGDIQTRVLGSLQLESVPENPEVMPRLVSELINFESEEYQTQLMPIRLKLRGEKIEPDGTTTPGSFDLFEDFAANGRLKLVLRCEDKNQYLGAALGDVYFRAADQPHAWNFFKSYLGIWAQMIVIISVGVAFSTFLNAPVTIIMTLVMTIIGFNTGFIRDMMSPEHAGGGPIESLYRIVTQENMVTELDPGITTTLLEFSDGLLVKMLSALTYVAPNFSVYNFSDDLVYGFAVNFDQMAIALLTAFAFFIGFWILGYFCLKTREIAK